MKIPQEVKDFIYKHQYKKTANELSLLIKQELNYDMSKERIKSFRGNHKLHSGLTGQFQKGNVPINKGTKGMFNVGGNKTSFKKGQFSANRKEIGSIRKNKDGYLYIKIADGKGNKNWEKMSHYVYKKHEKTIPENHVLIHLDGDMENNCIDNLLVVSKGVLGYLNKYFKLTGDKELNKTKILHSALFIKARERKNER